MWDLSKHERLEMEILEGLNSIKILNYLIFCGGTMLRMCHELNRYSVDLDFWLLDRERNEFIFDGIKNYLKENFTLKQSRNSAGGMVFEFSTKGYFRSLKIECQYRDKNVRYEEKIAYSKHSPIQVMVKAVTLDDMMKAKIETFLSRFQIRDAFDIEFLLKKGVRIKAPQNDLVKIHAQIKKFKAKDYKVTLGSLLEFKERQYYRTANFKLLLGKIEELL